MYKENNILIAEFLKWKKHEGYNYHTPFYQKYLSVGADICETHIFRFEELKFHTSWDWLMPVLIKILELTLDDEGNETYDSDAYYEILDLIPDLNQTYNGIVKFIEKHNKK